jgi:tetratricopeptide (TPR) repeat protein
MKDEKEAGRSGSSFRMRGCSEPLVRRKQTSPPNSCIACHVPRYSSSDIVHTASTDHRIVRRPRPFQITHLDGARLVDFYRDRFPKGDPQAQRNLGMGLMKLMRGGLLSVQRHGDPALLLLEVAVARHPEDVALRQSKALALDLQKRPTEALAEARWVLERRPGNWDVLVQAASSAQAQGQTKQAIDYWRRAVEINPVVAEYQLSLIELLIRAGQLDEAGRHCWRLLQLDPFNVPGRQARAGLLLKEGKKAEARAEFDLIRRLNPPDLAERQKWFEQQLHNRTSQSQR